MITTTRTLFDTLDRLHDRGVLNTAGLLAVCDALDAGFPLNRDHLVGLFGAAEVYRLMTVKDETRDQLLREAYELLDAFRTGADTDLSLREWLQEARKIVGADA